MSGLNDGHRTPIVAPISPASPPSPSRSSNYTQRSSPSHIRLKVKKPPRINARGEVGSDESEDDDDVNVPAAGEPSGIGTQRYRDDPDGDAPPEDGDTLSDGDSLMERGRIVVKKDWDDSDDEDDEDEDEAEHFSVRQEARRAEHQSLAAGVHPSHRVQGHPKSNARQRGPDSYLRTLRPSRERTRTWWRYLTNPAQPNSLSVTHVTLNLFAASLHPSTLLSTPFYFSRTGLKLGLIGMAIVAILGGVGGGLWVVLSRYVGGKKTVEAITGASFGRHSKQKARIGKLLAGLMLAAYSTGSAFIAYFALADLLLQVFFHYSPRGIPLHDRGFVTLVVGALLTAPLIVVPLAKRTLIRLATGTALILYPIVMAILFAKVYTWDPTQQSPPRSGEDFNFHLSEGSHNANPFRPPSIWAPYSLLPLLTLSSSPLQILAHNRSLRRNPSVRAHGAQDGSNVKAFLACQALQVVLVVGVITAFGVGIGTKGIEERLQWPVRANLFTSLPHDDDLINLARFLFVCLLSTHLAMCLAVGRSSWARVLKLLHLNPFKWSHNGGQIRLEGEEGDSAQNLSDTERTAGTSAVRIFGTQSRRQHCGKLARTSLGGALLWCLVAFLAYFSGVGGIRRKEKEGEEARYVRASEVLGLFGGGVGFVLPGVVWVLLFWVRKQRHILGGSLSSVSGAAASGWTNWVKGPLSVLARKGSVALGGSGGARTTTSDERTPYRPVPTWHQEASLEGDFSEDNAARPATSPQTNGASALADGDATRILLARKERQLQKRTKERRLWQDVLVLAAVLPCGLALLIFGAIELAKGGY